MKFIVNGNTYLVDYSQSDQLLLDYLRETLDLTGTKSGCGIGICGTCTVLIDGEALPSCNMKLADVENKSILTIEGLHAEDNGLHPLQQAFMDFGAVQCGFCIPGMILTAHALLLKNSQPSRSEIRRALAGNLCRCTGYQQIVDAIEAASIHYRELLHT